MKSNSECSFWFSCVVLRSAVCFVFSLPWSVTFPTTTVLRGWETVACRGDFVVLFTFTLFVYLLVYLFVCFLVSSGNKGGVAFVLLVYCAITYDAEMLRMFSGNFADRDMWQKYRISLYMKIKKSSLYLLAFLGLTILALGFLGTHTMMIMIIMNKIDNKNNTRNYYNDNDNALSYTIHICFEY